MITPNAEVRDFKPYRAQRQSVVALDSGPPSTTDGVQAQRFAAMEADASSTTDVNLSLVWRELMRGASNVVDSFFSESRCYLLLAACPAERATPIEGRRLEIVEAVLGGLRQKNIAIDLKLAPSTVALNSRLALESLGETCKPSRAHPILMLAARSMSSSHLTLARCASFATAPGRELRVIGLPRPDRRLHHVLPPAELAVVRLLIEGLSYQEIAQLRGTATRTIANQITAVFRRLQVSGRNELVQRLFFDEATQPLPPTNAQTLAPPDTLRATPAAAQHARRSA